MELTTTLTLGQAISLSSEVATAWEDHNTKVYLWLANPSAGNRSILACAFITLTSLVSYYRGRCSDANL